MTYLAGPHLARSTSIKIYFCNWILKQIYTAWLKYILADFKWTLIGAKGLIIYISNHRERKIKGKEWEMTYSPTDHSDWAVGLSAWPYWEFISCSRWWRFKDLAFVRHKSISFLSMCVSLFARRQCVKADHFFGLCVLYVLLSEKCNEDTTRWSSFCCLLFLCCFYSFISVNTKLKALY